MEKNHEEPIVVPEEELQQLIETLEKASTCLISTNKLIKYEGFWYAASDESLKNILMFQRHFCARDSDLIVAGHPKTGTTWLKSLFFATVNRNKYPKHESPLLKNHPRELVYRLESQIYGQAYPRPHHVDELPSPRLFSTHINYSSLPESISTTKCRILYICRNPLDTLVSLYYFVLNIMKKKKKDGEDFQPPSLEDFFEDFYDGRAIHGPYLDHVVEYWKLSLERPEKVFFIKYEDLKKDPENHVKKLAEFVGVPFTMEEEREVCKKIIELCSIKTLKELEVYKNGTVNKFLDHKDFFRKGEVGDGINHFTPDLVERMNKLTQQKLHGTGLSL
ncbi:flavonol sulfotransferase-like [Beta vulgaris subsp. vulgaris]|uniref:flavonol sulfotransferase-like n=1 Tax=Beta vulgaris subsp. vulgaris TaxID=3555 RepID=UPI002548E745|nr:flavonol sulfotransferase-like [Beta vulgaris subsp. vulgaris]